MKKTVDISRILANLVLATIVVSPFIYFSLALPGLRHEALYILLFGYESLFFLLCSLLIGPLNLLRVRKNPVNLNLRRDVGIWAAITGCYHVALVFQGRGSQEILAYFFKDASFVPWLNLFGLSNDSGLLATILLLLLWALSNTFSLRLLKGKRWKRLQQTNYLLLPLAIVHTLGYQYLAGRAALFGVLVLLLTLLVLLIQCLGIALVLQRKRATLHKAAHVKM